MHILFSILMMACAMIYGPEKPAVAPTGGVVISTSPIDPGEYWRTRPSEPKVPIKSKVPIKPKVPAKEVVSPADLFKTFCTKDNPETWILVIDTDKNRNIKAYKLINEKWTIISIPETGHFGGASKGTETVDKIICGKDGPKTETNLIVIFSSGFEIKENTITNYPDAMIAFDARTRSWSTSCSGTQTISAPYDKPYTKRVLSTPSAEEQSELVDLHLIKRTDNLKQLKELLETQYNRKNTDLLSKFKGAYYTTIDAKIVEFLGALVGEFIYTTMSHRFQHQTSQVVMYDLNNGQVIIDYSNNIITFPEYTLFNKILQSKLSLIKDQVVSRVGIDLLSDHGKTVLSKKS